ncbi:hypothetical protein HJG54_04200 [Leptolyngbya sp. NK1-12]|uniref:Type II secretion system protein GspC N-terminal domain-containing protein n=1 Tax=Leptolyngbya sp. NK1-12 TaxID=2547451 RepID=A0AA96WCQ0_9CYAN|nr:hypothetical protein [Leptolyngbya sp. NK1-12]WNZ22145.1 hypothetical protein HJG54_04200 [Leptolyngbya sp. NK1-12]
MTQPVSDPQTVPASQDTAAEELAALRFDLSQAVTANDMETNADTLIGMLFADVERMLERGVPLPVEEAADSSAQAVVEPVAEPAAPQIVLPLETILPPKLSPRDLIPQPPELKESEPAPAAEPTAEPTPSKPRWNSFWVAVLCSSLLLSAGILSYLFRDQLTQVWLMVLQQQAEEPTPREAASPTDPKAQEKQDFLQYVGRALDRLAKKEAEVAVSPVPPSPSPSPAASPSVIERVYVPIYPSAQTPASAPGTVPAAPPTATANPAAQRASTPSPAPAARSSPVPNIAAASNHTLIGVLELGDRSAALFDVNGTPQRVNIGEPIGSSGWTLVSISNQEAIVRRNGEVRSIYVGQKF